MKVYVKKGECQSLIPGIIASIAFLICPVYVFFTMCSADSFMEGLSKVGSWFIFAIIFLCFDIYFFSLLLKKSKKYTAKLISKTKDKYKGKDIIYMVFRAVKEKELNDDFVPREYRCFTYQDNNLFVNNIYNIYIKEFNWKIKKIDNEIADSIIKTPTSVIKPIFISIELIMLFNVLLGVLGIIYYKKYIFTNIILIIIFSIAFLYTKKVSDQYTSDNEKYPKTKNNTNLQKYSILLDNGKKVNNLIVKDLLKYLLILPIIWFTILYIFNNFSLNNMFYPFIVITIPMAMLLLLIICYINYDNRLIKKHKLNILTSKNIENINNFIIFRPTSNITFEKYFIVDLEDNTLIANVQKNGILGNKYLVYSSSNKVIAEIRKKIFSTSIEYIIRPINIQPYSVRLKLLMGHDYEINGINNYFIKGNIDATENIIFNNNDEIIAKISARKENNWYNLGNTSVEINNYQNNINIILISLCITMGNFESVRRRHNNNN